MNMQQPSKFTPILISTLVMTVISLFPLLNLINLLCCAGIMIGAFAGTAYYNKQLTAANLSIRYKDGAAIGILSGIVSALVVVLVSTVISIVLKENPVPEAFKMLDSQGFQLPPEIEKFLQRISDEYNERGFSITLTLITLAADLITYPLFGAFGGILSVSILTRRKINPPSSKEGQVG